MEGFIALVVVGAIFGGGTLMGSVGRNSEVNGLQKSNNELVLKLDEMKCKFRGLELTTVKGITLCMNSETRSLHKIDEEGK